MRCGDKAGSYQVCDNGRWVTMPLAAGTTCTGDGQIVAANAKTRKVPPQARAVLAI